MDTRRTIFVSRNLAALFEEQGKYADAVTLVRDVLQQRRLSLSDDHADMLLSLNNLAQLFWDTGRLDQSIPMYESALSTQEKDPGRQHPATLVTVANLGINYKEAGRLAEAIPLLEEAFEAAKQQPNLGFVGAQLLDAYVQSGESNVPENRDKANSLRQQLLADARQSLPIDSPQLAELLEQVGMGAMKQMKCNEAESLLRESLEIREQTQNDVWSMYGKEFQPRLNG